jgi:hypothetical protein
MSKFEIGSKVIVSKSWINWMNSHLVWTYGRNVNWFKSKKECKLYDVNGRQEIDKLCLSDVFFWTYTNFSKKLLKGVIVKKGSNCWLVNTKLETELGCIKKEFYVDEQYLKLSKAKGERKSK